MQTWRGEEGRRKGGSWRLGMPRGGGGAVTAALHEASRCARAACRPRQSLRCGRAGSAAGRATQSPGPAAGGHSAGLSARRRVQRAATAAGQACVPTLPLSLPLSLHLPAHRRTQPTHPADVRVVQGGADEGVKHAHLKHGGHDLAGRGMEGWSGGGACSCRGSRARRALLARCALQLPSGPAHSTHPYHTTPLTCLHKSGEPQDGARVVVQQLPGAAGAGASAGGR